MHQLEAIDLIASRVESAWEAARFKAEAAVYRIRYAFAPKPIDRLRGEAALRLMWDHRITRYVMVDGEEDRVSANIFVGIRNSMAQFAKELQTMKDQMTAALSRMVGDPDAKR